MYFVVFIFSLIVKYGFCCRFGSDQLKREFLAPVISGEMVSCIGVSELSGGSDVASEFIVTQLIYIFLVQNKIAYFLIYVYISSVNLTIVGRVFFLQFIVTDVSNFYSF